MAKEVKIETEIKRRIRQDEYPEFSKEDATYIAKRLLKEGRDYSELHDLVETCRKEVRDYWAQDFDKVRDSRGILPAVWNRRPYVRWPAFEHQGLSEVRIIVDRDAIEAGYDGLTIDQTRYMKTLAGRSPGWVITRWRVPGCPEKIYPEIRPDHKVETGPPIRHWHGEGPLTWGMRKRFKDMGISVIVRGTEAFRQHCNKINAENAESAPCAMPHEWVLGWHEHRDEAKYVFAPSWKVPLATTHHHDEGDPGRYFGSNPEELQRHIEDWHVKHPETVEYHGPNTGWHTHTRMVKDRDNPLAKRLDIHPMALERLPDAKLVYFGIEGCLKADAILSAIIREDRNESVFSVPSVSLWDAKELGLFADTFLKGKIVVVVPDADWVDKDMVIAHARFAERFLEDRGIVTFVAAPPLTEHGTVEHKGIDDFLGEGEGSLNDLLVLAREQNPNLTEEYLYACQKLRPKYKKQKPDKRAATTDKELMMALAHFADSHGRVKATHKSLGKIIQRDTSTVTRHINSLLEDRWLTAETKPKDVVGAEDMKLKPVPVKEEEEPEWEVFDGELETITRSNHTQDGILVYGPEEWKNSARVIVPEHLRGYDRSPVLSKVLGPYGLGKAKALA